MGNETEETIRESEIKGVLDVNASSLATRGAYAKRALVDYALAQPSCSNQISLLASNWNITATTVSDVYATTNTKPPLSDIKLLRLYYQDTYWSTLYHIVKSIDPNHLFFGTWVLGFVPPSGGSSTAWKSKCDHRLKLFSDGLSWPASSICPPGWNPLACALRM